MQLAPENIYEQLEFDKILDLLEKECLGELGKTRVRKLVIQTEKFMIARLLNEVDEMKTTLEHNHPFPVANYEDITKDLRYLEVEDYVLPIDGLQRINVILIQIKNIFEFFKKGFAPNVIRQVAYPALYDIVKNTSFNDELNLAIDQVIDENGDIRPDASPELMRIRKLILSKRKELDKRFREMVQQYKSRGMLKDTVESFRNGRRVLSVPVENKRKIKGIIHDESTTGKTAFIEPEQVIDINNDIFDAEQEERREIYRILKELSAKIRPFVPLIKVYQNTVARYDFILAKARLAQKINASKPKLKSQPYIDIKNGLHPILYLKNLKEKKGTVPFSLQLEKNRILILSECRRKIRCYEICGVASNDVASWYAYSG